MMFLNEMKDLRIYKNQFRLPIYESDKFHNSAVYLLTPNSVSSTKTMKLPYIINKLSFESYYIEKNLSYYISPSNLLELDQGEKYIYNSSENIFNESNTIDYDDCSIEYFNIDQWNEINNLLLVFKPSNIGNNTIIDIEEKANVDCINVDDFLNNTELFNKNNLSNGEIFIKKYIIDNYGDKINFDSYIKNGLFEKELNKFIDYIVENLNDKKYIIKGNILPILIFNENLYKIKNYPTIIINPDITYISEEEDIIDYTKNNKFNKLILKYKEILLNESVIESLGFTKDDFIDITTFSRALERDHNMDNSNKLIRELVKTSTSLIIGNNINTVIALSVSIASIINIIIKQDNINDEIKYKKLVAIKKILSSSLVAHKMLLRLTKNKDKKDMIQTKYKEISKSISKINSTLTLLDVEYQVKRDLEEANNIDIYSNTLQLLENGFIDNIETKTISDINYWEKNLNDYGINSNILYITGSTGSGKSTLSKKIAKKYNAEYVPLDCLYRVNTNISELEHDKTILQSNLLMKFCSENKNYSFYSFSELVKFTLNQLRLLSDKNKLYVIESTALLECVELLRGCPIIIPTPSIEQKALYYLNIDKFRGNNIDIDDRIELAESYSKSEEKIISNLDTNIVPTSIPPIHSMEFSSYRLDDFINNKTNILFIGGGKYNRKNELAEYINKKINSILINCDLLFEENNSNDIINNFKKEYKNISLLDFLNYLNIKYSNNKIILTASCFDIGPYISLYNNISYIAIPEKLEEILNFSSNINELYTDIALNEMYIYELNKINKIYSEQISFVFEYQNKLLCIKQDDIKKITLPYIDVTSNTNLENVLINTIKEKLGITVKNPIKLYTNEFDITYQDKPGIYHITNTVFFVHEYSGVLTVDDHNIDFLNINNLYLMPSFRKSTTLNKYLEYRSKSTQSNKIIKNNKGLSFSGYESDIYNVKRIINSRYLSKIYNDFGYNRDMNNINVIVTRDEEITDIINSDIITVLSKDIYEKNYITNYNDYLKTCMYLNLIYYINPSIDERIAFGVAESLSSIYDKQIEVDGEGEYQWVSVFNRIKNKYGMDKIIDIIKKNNLKAVVKYAWEFGLSNIMTINLKEDNITDVNQLSRKIKRAGRKGSVYKINAISRNIKQTNDNLDPEFSDNSDKINKNSITISETSYIEDDESKYIFIFEKYENFLKKTLYKDRIKQTKDLLLLYKNIKKENPFIKYTFLDIKKYKNKNIFIDLSYYNDAYFRNSIYKSVKGLNIYFELMKKLILDENINYKKKTVFIPVRDWDLDTNTKVWLYKDNINPISIIYTLMKTNPQALINTFNDIDFVFLSDNAFFKINFNNDTVSKYSLFLNLIKRLRNTENVIDTDNDEREISQKSIKAEIIEKIETSQNIKIKKFSLTGDTETNTSNLEKNKEKLVSIIDKAASSSMSTPDALKNLDNNEFKDLLLDIIDEENNSQKISKSRIARFNKLDEDIRRKTINNMPIEQLINSKNDNKLKETSLNVNSINDDWNHLRYINFDKDSTKNLSEIFTIFYDLKNKKFPSHIISFDIEDRSTSEDWVDLVICKLEDFQGTRFTIKLYIPQLIDHEMKLRGNKKTINLQSVLMPIVKTDLDTCQIVSNYNKIFIRRFGNSSGKSMQSTDRLIKSINKYIENGDKLVVTYGENSSICNKYELPMDYIDLAKVYNTIKLPNFTFYFNQDELRQLKKVDDTLGLPIGITNDNNIIYYTPDKGGCCSEFIIYMIFEEINDFVDIFNATKNASKYTYSKATIMNSKIPLIVICGFSVGLINTLNKANIIYEIKQKIDRSEKNDVKKDYIKFKDSYLIYNVDYNSSLLLNGLKECNTEDYNITDLVKKTPWIDFLEVFNAEKSVDGLDNFFDCMIDPITKSTLDEFKLPTTYIDVLLYANVLLADNNFENHTYISSRRFRRSELIAGYTYKVLADAYGIYANTLRHSRTKATISIKDTAVIEKILLDPSSSDISCINAIKPVEDRNSVTSKGLSGLNSDRAYSLDKRTYDDSMLNVLAMSTGFAGNVGITRQTTIDPIIESEKGFIESINNDTSKLSVSKTLSITEGLVPYGTVRDDPFRSAMTFIQTAKHQVRTKKSDPLLVTNGTDEALPYITTDLFAFKAKDDGIISEITDNYIVVTYNNGFADYIDLTESQEKNSDGGYFTPIKLSPANNLKLNTKFKKGEILAYDKLSFSSSLGEDDNLSYNAGTLMKIAILNTDEGYEDSAAVSEQLIHDMSTQVTIPVTKFLPKETNVFIFKSVGDKIEEGDILLSYQTPYDQEDINILLKNLAGEENEISELGRVPVRSSVTGEITDIKIYRTVEIEELSPSLQKIVIDYEKQIKNKKKIMKKYNISSNKLDPDYKVPPTGKLKNAVGGVLIEFYLKYNDVVSIGDKIVYYSANKGIVKYIFPTGKEPYTDLRPNEPIDGFISIGSINGRMVTSIPSYAASAKLMVELDRTCKDMAGIKYDDSKI